jgi:hypothetical protein
VCAHVPGPAGETDVTWLRVLLVADLLARTAELHNLQVLTVEAFADQAAAQASERVADALGIHPPAVRASLREAHASPGGPIDVHVVSRDTGAGERSQSGLAALVGAAQLRRVDHHKEAAACDVLAGHGDDPLAVRFALMSLPCHQPADLTQEVLVSDRETVAHWRRQVAIWAESPSRPIPAGISGKMRAAFGDLDTVSALALLRDLMLDADVPTGAKFETFVYADRVLGLDLPRDIGRTSG